MDVGSQAVRCALEAHVSIGLAVSTDLCHLGAKWVAAPQAMHRMQCFDLVLLWLWC